jgi:parvulin-like peptidyl-prolyl isomerase
MRVGVAGRALAVMIALGAAQAHAAGDVVAQHGAITLTTDDVRLMLAALDPAVREKIQHDPAALTGFVRERLVQLILLQEARDKKWDQKPEIVAAANQAHDAAIVSSYLLSVSAPEAGYPSDAEIQAAYDANKTRFLIPRQYQLAQIFIAVPAGSARTADEDAKKRLLDLRTQATKSRADFASMAKQNSQDRATVDKGGDLGWLREDELAPDVKTAVAGLQEGGVSDPIRMPDGWHLLKLVGTKPASTAPLADVKATLAEALRKQRTQQNAQAYAAATLRTQPAQIDEITLGKLATK